MLHSMAKAELVHKKHHAFVMQSGLIGKVCCMVCVAIYSVGIANSSSNVARGHTKELTIATNAMSIG